MAFTCERCEVLVVVYSPLGGADRLGDAAAVVTPTRPTLRASAPAVVHAAILLTSPVGKSAWFKDPDGNTLAVFQPE